MSESINIETYLSRQQEVFNTFIASSGRETSLLPLIEKYSNEDKKEYTYDDIFEYILSYTNSNLITEEELKKFEQTKLTTSDIIFKRGKILVQRLIEAKGNFNDVMCYGEIFAKEDGKINPYSKRYLQKCRDYYLDKTKNQDKKDTYLKVIGLAKNNKNYTVDLLNQLLDYNNTDKAINFINEINISKKSLEKLLATYKVVYPTNNKEIKQLEEIIKKTFSEATLTISYISPSKKSATPLGRIETLKKLIAEYLISDQENIAKLFPKYRFNSYKFQEAMKDAETSSDLILKNLLAKFYAKENSIKETRRSIIEAIVQGYENGINYGNGYREFNKYDFYSLLQYNSIDVLLESAKTIYDEIDYQKIEVIFNQYRLKNTHKTSHSLAASIGKVSKNGKVLTKEEILLITDYLEYAKLPLEEELFIAAAMRYLDSDLIFEIIPEEEQRVVNK